MGLLKTHTDMVFMIAVTVKADMVFVIAVMVKTLIPIA